MAFCLFIGKRWSQSTQFFIAVTGVVGLLKLEVLVVIQRVLRGWYFNCMVARTGVAGCLEVIRRLLLSWHLVRGDVCSRPYSAYVEGWS